MRVPAVQAVPCHGRDASPRGQITTPQPDVGRRHPEHQEAPTRGHSPKRGRRVGSLTTLRWNNGGLVPEGFTLSSLAMFDGCNNPYEHVASINMQIDIIGTPDSLKGKMLPGTFKDASLRWYIGLPCASINNYQELERNFVHNEPVQHSIGFTRIFEGLSRPLKWGHHQGCPS